MAYWTALYDLYYLKIRGPSLKPLLIFLKFSLEKQFIFGGIFRLGNTPHTFHTTFSAT